jgi:anti-sigma factor (TIGR02949 family)
MDCNEVRPLLSAAIDRELSAAEALQVERHLRTCDACRREMQALQAVSGVTRAAETFRAPEALRARIVDALPAVGPAPYLEGKNAASAAQPPARQNGTEQARKPSREARERGEEKHRRDRRRGESALGWASAAWRGLRGNGNGTRTGTGLADRRRATALGWPLGIAFAAIAFAVGIALVAHRPARTNTEFVDELVQSHVRAQLSGHDIDVISSDQHTVKPWFNGRLDYAPPVEDLAAEGFALAGGRLDYAGHRRVAVLVYRYRKHIVDVYVMPETESPSPPAPSSLTTDGYALASWRAHGMRWWAVSDAEPAVLARLRAALTARLDRPLTGEPQ